jgi:hypothetical protein
MNSEIDYDLATRAASCRQYIHTLQFEEGQMPIKRICLEPALKKYDSAWNITVDLFLNENGTSTDKMTAFGARGGVSPSAEEIEPFLLFTDGTLEFGTGWDEEQHDCHLNLRGEGKVIKAHEYFTYSGEGEEITYRVTQVVDLK